MGFEASNFTQVPLPAILCRFMTQTMPTFKRAFNSQVSWPLVALQSKKRASLPEVEALYGQKTINFLLSPFVP